MSVENATQLLMTIGHIVPNAATEENIEKTEIESLYFAGLYKQGDVKLRNLCQSIAARKGLVFMLVSTIGGHHELDLKDKYTCLHKWRIWHLHDYPQLVPHNIRNVLTDLQSAHEYLYIAAEKSDPVLLFRIPEKRQGHGWFYCVEIAKW